MMRYDNYIFDYDYTLVDETDGLNEGYSRSFKAIGMPYDASKVTHYAKMTLWHVYQEVGTNASYDAFLDGFLSLTPQELGDNARLYHDTLSTIKTIKRRGGHVSIVTSEPKDAVWHALKRFGIDGAIDIVVGSDDTKRHKPEPDPLLFCLDKCGYKPSRSVYVGDSPNDVLCADNAGIDGFLLCRDGNGGHRSISTLTQLVA